MALTAPGHIKPIKHKEHKMEYHQTFIDFLKAVWKDNTPEEAFHLWKWHISNYPETAKKFLDSIALTLQSPPDDFIETVQENGWIFLEHEDQEGNTTPYTFREYVEWFQEMYDRFKKTLEELPDA